MKKKKLKSLSLKKASVSKLNGGLGTVPFPGTITQNVKDCLFTADIFQCTTYTQLNTICGCETIDLNCQSNAPAGCADSIVICLL